VLRRPAPAGGGSGADRGLWTPAGPDPGVAQWQGRWPLPLKRSKCRRLSGREQETQRVSPARAGRCPTDRQVREQRRPAPDPAGEKRPPWAGRALAGDLGPRLGKRQRCDVAGAMAPARETGHPEVRKNAIPGGTRKCDPRFPRPCGTVPCRPASPGTTKGQRPARRVQSARRGRGGRWPGALAPGWTRGSVAQWQGRWPLPERPGIPKCVRTPLRAGPGNATRVSPARARRCPGDRWVRAPRKASARPGGCKAPAVGGAGAGRGLLPPAGV